MKPNYRTKKQKKNIRKRQTKKKYRTNSRLKYRGGSEAEKEDIKDDKKELEGKKNADDIMNEVKEEREKDVKDLLPEVPKLNLGDSEIVQKTGDIVDGITVNAIEGVGDLVGVDLSNSEETGKKLDEIKESISNPENNEKVKEIVENAAEVGAVALEAADPFIEPLVDKSIKIGEGALSKMGKSGVKILLNTAEEIPGVGVLIGTIRSLDSAGQAILAATNATSEIITTTSDSVNASTKNFNELMDEKGDVTNRIDKSVKEFEAPLKSVPGTDKVPTGGRGGTKRHNKHKNITKRVRFAL